MATPAGAADENPLLPLAKAAQDCDAKFKTFLDGKDLVTAFTPWIVKTDGEGGLQVPTKDVSQATRDALVRAKVVRVEFAQQSLEVLFYKGPALRYAASFDLLTSEKDVRVFAFSGTAFAEDEDLNEQPEIRSDATHALHAPFVAAGNALAKALRSDAWKTLPLAEPARLADWTRFSRRKPAVVLERLKGLRKALGEAAGEIRDLQADRVAFSLGTNGAFLRAKDGTLVGALRGRFVHAASTPLVYQMEETLAGRKPEGQ